MRPCPCTSTAHASVKCRFPTYSIRVLLISSFRKAARTPPHKPILARTRKKFAAAIILSIIPRFCNPCTALTVPFAIAWLQLVVRHPMNSGGFLSISRTSFTAIETSEFENCFCLFDQVSRMTLYAVTSTKKHATISIRALKTTLTCQVAVRRHLLTEV